MLTCEVCVGAGSGEVVSGLVLESEMGLGMCVLRDRGGPSHDPDYPELPTGHHRDVALTPQVSEKREAQLGSMGELVEDAQTLVIPPVFWPNDAGQS